MNYNPETKGILEIQSLRQDGNAPLMQILRLEDPDL